MTYLALSKHTRNVLSLFSPPCRTWHIRTCSGSTNTKFTLVVWRIEDETEFLAQQVNGNTEEKQIQGFLDTRNPWRGNHRGRFPQFSKELLKGISPLHWHYVAHPGEPRVRRCMPVLDYRFRY